MSKYIYLLDILYLSPIVLKEMNMDYIQRLRNLREDHDYTQDYVAKYLGTSQTMYARYERRANELPMRYFIKLCQLYGVSADDILGLKPTNI